MNLPRRGAFKGRTDSCYQGKWGKKDYSNKIINGSKFTWRGNDGLLPMSELRYWPLLCLIGCGPSSGGRGSLRGQSNFGTDSGVEYIDQGGGCILVREKPEGVEGEGTGRTKKTLSRSGSLYFMDSSAFTGKRLMRGVESLAGLTCRFKRLQWAHTARSQGPPMERRNNKQRLMRKDRTEGIRVNLVQVCVFLRTFSLKNAGQGEAKESFPLQRRRGVDRLRGENFGSSKGRLRTGGGEKKCINILQRPRRVL